MALIAAHLNAGHSGGDSVAIGIYSPSSPTSIPPYPPFSPSLISLMVSVDVKHHVYLLTYVLAGRPSGSLSCIAMPFKSGIKRFSSSENNFWTKPDSQTDGRGDSRIPPTPHTQPQHRYDAYNKTHRQAERAVHTNVLQSLQDDHPAALAPSVAVGLVGERVALARGGHHPGLAQLNEHVGG